MLQTAARPRINRGQQALTRSVQAPVGGLNDRDPLSAMPENCAVVLENFWCLPSKVVLRNGKSPWAFGIGAQVETLMGYRPASGNAALFAAAGTAFYDVSAGGIPGNYLSLPGTGGNYASTPDSAALDITGDIDIIVYAAATDWTPASQMAVVGKWNTSSNERSYNLVIQTGSTGKLMFQLSTDGTSTGAVGAISSIAPTIADGSGVWVRVTRASATGNVTFYTSLDSPNTAPSSVSWTQLGTIISTPASGLFSGTSDLEVGAQNGGANNNFVGKIYSAYVYNGIGGTLAASMVANDTTPAVSSWTSALTSEVWTANGTAAIAGTVVQKNLSNARWQYVNIATSGGNFLLAVNGVDKLRGWNGTTWWKDGDGTHDITGIDTSTCATINMFKRRIWMVKTGTTSIYYGPVDSIAGEFTEIDFGSLFVRGGSLLTMVNWSLDAGVGIDDYAAFISSEGEVALYKGSDPSSATTWALVGTFYLGSPIGQRCTTQYGNDVLLISMTGISPLSKALITGDLNTSIALTDKIQNTISAATTNYGSNFGWQIIPFPGQNMIILNVPVSSGGQVQYAMNTISGAWSKFTGWAANCFELFDDDLYFGGNGTVDQAWNTRADSAADINAAALQAFNYMKQRNGLKEFTLVRPLLSLTGGTSISLGVNTDFDMTVPTGVPTFNIPATSPWGTSKWGTATWRGLPVTQKQWQSGVGVGYCAGLYLKSTSNGGQLEWASTDYAWKPGGIL